MGASCVVLVVLSLISGSVRTTPYDECGKTIVLGLF